MLYAIQHIAQTRQNFDQLVETLSSEQLNAIPAGFTNNIVWNFGHILATQQILCYKLSGNHMLIDEKLIESYRKGTKPEAFVQHAEVQAIRSLLSTTLEQLKTDYAAGLFSQFTQYPTSYGITLNSIDEALLFNAAHEAMHFGYAMAQKRALGL